MPRDVEVDDATAIMADDEEAVEYSESDSWDREEIHRRNRFSVISQEGEPALGALRISRRSLHPSRDRSFGNVEPEHQELSVDARCTPSRILSDHTEDQISNLSRDSPPSDCLAYPGDRSPIERKSSTMPPNHCFRTDDDEDLFPT